MSIVPFNNITFEAEDSIAAKARRCQYACYALNALIIRCNKTIDDDVFVKAAFVIADKMMEQECL